MEWLHIHRQDELICDDEMVPVAQGAFFLYLPIFKEDGNIEPEPAEYAIVASICWLIKDLSLLLDRFCIKKKRHITFFLQRFIVLFLISHSKLAPIIPNQKKIKK